MDFVGSKGRKPYKEKMDGYIIIYDTSNLSRVKKTRFGRKLYGYTDKSNNGQYEYYRSGLLDEIPSRKLIRGVVIVKKKEADKVLNLMKKNTTWKRTEDK
ncbi:hypothetical protein AKJ39_05000 [candidate division MSBL1 archaeon SCGC-AAA259J03]|uniref:Uncharacterized protein n=1 Tax=candidate division MSBL1 archaeon SCGC-AAA259J03 TaxID=1698269 RepID=A0A656YVD3_9EURY|nr:hypothetical protein AKJ39_05000 [candidate division MSBL1 archaeon SCGC-AAA259J03]